MGHKKEAERAERERQTNERRALDEQIRCANIADMRVAEERRAQLKKLAEEDRQAKAIQRALYEAKQKGQMAEDAISSVMSPDDKTGAAFDMVRRVQKPEGRSQLLKSGCKLVCRFKTLNLFKLNCAQSQQQAYSGKAC